MKYINRIIGLPGVIIILFINYAYRYICHVWHYIRFGGESIYYHSKTHESSLKARLDKILDNYEV